MAVQMSPLMEKLCNEKKSPEVTKGDQRNECERNDSKNFTSTSSNRVVAFSEFEKCAIRRIGIETLSSIFKTGVSEHWMNCFNCSN